MDILEQIAHNLQDGEDGQVQALTRAALEQKIPPKKILDSGLLTGMAVISDRFKNHEIFLPDVLLAARAMYAGLDVLKPRLIQDKVPSLGKVVIGTVQSDLHDIGKNLVGIMLKGAGFDVIDLGNDVSPERFVATAEKEGARAIGMSALLTTTMPAMKQVVDLLAAKGLQGRIKTIIGGAPVSAVYASDIGADAYGYDAAQAVDCIKGLIA